MFFSAKKKTLFFIINSISTCYFAVINELLTLNKLLYLIWIGLDWSICKSFFIQSQQQQNVSKFSFLISDLKYILHSFFIFFFTLFFSCVECSKHTSRLEVLGHSLNKFWNKSKIEWSACNRMGYDSWCFKVVYWLNFRSLSFWALTNFVGFCHVNLHIIRISRT